MNCRLDSQEIAQAVRLGNLFDLIDGSATIQVRHLKAALSVWAHRKVRTVKRKKEVEPLDYRLLMKIEASPGITRTGLHGAMGNNLKSTELSEALASLETNRLAHHGHCQAEGGGRPAECWYPRRKAQV